MIRPIVLTCIAALAVFAVIQDRVTVSGVGQYVETYHEAVAARRPPSTIDDVMKPAVARGARQGALWSGATLVAGVIGTVAVRRRVRRG